MKDVLIVALNVLFHWTPVTSHFLALGEHFILQFYNGGDYEAELLLFTSEPKFVTVRVNFPGHLHHDITVKSGILVQEEIESSFLCTKVGKCRAIMLMSYASKMFGVYLKLFKDTTMMESTLALPVSNFGVTYYVFTLEYNPAFTVVAAHDETIVNISMKNENRGFRLYYDESFIDSNSNFTINLNSLEAYVLLDCDDKYNSEGLTGTKIQANQIIGVLAGNCKTRFTTGQCMPTSLKDQITIEAMFPAETFGLSFILLDTYVRHKEGVITILAREKMTAIFVTTDQLTETRFSIANAGDNMKFTGFSGHRLARSDKPVSVAYYQTATCDKDLGAPTTCIVVPTEMYSDGYIWRTPNIGSTVKNYVLIFFNKNESNSLLLDGKALQELLKLTTTDSNQTVRGSDKLIGPIVPVKEGTHDARSTTNVKFGCYIFGFDTLASYMSPAGTVSSFPQEEKEVEEKCVVRAMLPGDQIDNDCDGAVDEEKDNKKDDDSDGRVDEDLTEGSLKEAPDRMNALLFLLLLLLIPLCIVPICILRINRKRRTRRQSSPGIRKITIDKVIPTDPTHGVDAGEQEDRGPGHVTFRPQDSLIQL